MTIMTVMSVSSHIAASVSVSTPRAGGRAVSIVGAVVRELSFYTNVLCAACVRCTLYRISYFVSALGAALFP